MDDKISPIKNFPQPRTVEKVLSFIGLCGHYRTFINGFAKIAPLLNKLLKKEIPFYWKATSEKSFIDLKSEVINAPCLAFSDYKFPFIMYKDASALGLGAALMQPDARG